MVSPTDILRRAPRILSPVARAYERRLRQFGNDPRGVFWQNQEFQFRRFELLSRIFRPADQEGGVTIHDFGCGYGALFDYLADQPVMTNSTYLGTDMSSRMIAAAREKITDPRARFLRHLQAVDEADYTLVSGTFNMHLGQDEADWEAYVKASLQQLWSKTRRGLAFNMLRDDAEEIFDGLYYINGHDLFDFCATHLSPHVTLQNDHPLPDWTLYVRRQAD
ncbi:MAG: methyltransferase domain-containing protein [Rhodospirillales bacterium]|nr:methyltransferase domain-containing protein [Rhodospirillales bacterium]